MNLFHSFVMAAAAVGLFAETAAAGALGSGENIPHFQLNWSDEFDQGYASTGYPEHNAPNPAVWDKDRYGISTWYGGQINATNGSGGPDYERQAFMGRPENLRIENGVLVIELRADGAQGAGWKDRYGNVNDLHTSAIIESRTDSGSAKPSFSRHSRVEFRAKIPHQPGVWPALWMCGTSGDWPGCGELDVLEYWGRGTTEEFGYVSTNNIHWANSAGNHAESMRYYAMRRPSDEFHIWAMERDNEKILMFYDDQLVAWHDITSADQSELRDLDGNVIINFCYTGIDPAMDRVQMQVDYVREYFFKPGVRRHYPPEVGLGGNSDTGAMIEAYVNQPLPLVGAATGDGLPGAGFTYEWQRLSGPGSVTFSDSKAARTTAVFSEPGTYDVRLVAHDGQYANSAWRRINVRPGSGNTAPMVATTPRTVVAGQPVKLSALVADDGLPNHALTVTWSGGEQTKFSDVHALEPTVTFTNPGDAYLWLQASDGELESTTARIHFQVVAPPAEGNQPPVVSAGEDQTVAAGTEVVLAGTVTDDGYPEFRTTQQWSQVSGPAQATFSDPTLFAPTASFPTAGTYVLRLTATDGALSSNDTVTIVAGGAGNHAPAITTSKPASLACTLNTAGTVQLAATDADSGDTLSWSVATPPAHGTASVSTVGLARYTPATGYVGADSFVVRVSDGHGGTDSITINATVTTTKPQVTAVTATPSAAAGVGSTVTLSATVVPGTGHPIDHVTFSLGGTSLGNATYNSGTGKWTLAWTASSLGRQTITATGYGNDAQTATGTVTVVVGTAGTYGNGGAPWVAGSGTLRIEAEAYDEGGEGVAYHDTDARQGTSTVRSAGTANEVDIVELATGTDALTQAVGYIEAGEWLRYTVTMPSTERYTVRLRVANGTGAASTGAVSLRWQGAVVAGPLSVPATGGWSAYTTIEVTGVTLTAGTDLLQLVCNTDGFDCNWIELVPEVTKTPATVTLGGLNQTYNGSAHPVTVTTVPAGLTVTVTYAGSATAPVAAGSYAVVATVADSTYTGSASGTLTVAKAATTIAWAAPTGITYGTALSSTQLNATASVPGTFSYTPAAGTVLHAGSGQTLQATFTPTDTVNYATTTKTVTLAVAKAPLVAQAENQERGQGAANATLSISYSGFVNGDTAAVLDALPTASTTATTASASGSYPITLSGGSDGDYAFTLRSGTLTVTGIDAPRYTRAPQPATAGAGSRAVFAVGVTSSRTLSYQWQVSTDGGSTWSAVVDGQIYSGATSEELAFTARPEMRDRQFRCLVSDGVNPALASAAAALTVPWSQFSALSARAAAGTGEQTLTLGFVFAGGGKPAMVRGVGPGLLDGDATLAGRELADPQLKLFELRSGAFALLTSNDNWGGASALSQKFAELGQGALAAGSKDAALYLDALGQTVYTAQISGVTGTGVALAEAYDADFTDKSKRLTALSVRNQVGTGADVLIAGFVISGDAPKRVIVRGVGPALAQDVASYLADPQLLVHRLQADGKGWDLVGSNDNWDGTAATAALFERVGMSKLDAGSKDAALVLELEPGVYTAQVSGVGGTTGVALAEIYEAP